jgi:hypothetical protein
LTGDPLAYVHSKVKYGSVGFSNPLWILFDALRRGIAEHRFEHAFNAGMVLFGTAAVLLNRKTLGVNYVLLGLMLIGFPLLAGESMIPGSSRYMAATLPIFSGLALAGARYSCTELLFMICLLLQGLVMVMWSLGGRFLV